MGDKPDFIEVGRAAHELIHRHGWAFALPYAAKLAADALAEGKIEESEFWKAVERSLTPRSANS